MTEPQLVHTPKNIIADPILLHGGPESIELFCRKFHAMVLMEIINNLSKISYVSATTFSIAGKLSQHWRNAFIIRFVDWFPETGKQTFLTEELRNYFISRGFTIEYGYIRNEETEHLPCLMKQTGFLNEVKFYLIIKPNKLFFLHRYILGLRPKNSSLPSRCRTLRPSGPRDATWSALRASRRLLRPLRLFFCF